MYDKKEVKMSLFDDLVQGLEEAIEIERGNRKARTRVLSFKPLQDFTPDQIKEVRNGCGLSQKSFSAVMGVSVKTVEAWECGRTHPSGPALRVLERISVYGVDDLIKAE